MGWMAHQTSITAWSSSKPIPNKATEWASQILLPISLIMTLFGPTPNECLWFSPRSILTSTSIQDYDHPNAKVQKSHFLKITSKPDFWHPHNPFSQHTILQIKHASLNTHFIRPKIFFFFFWRTWLFISLFPPAAHLTSFPTNTTSTTH
jgi:hypothetical protein